MDEALINKSLFSWYREMVNLDQEVNNEGIMVAAKVVCKKIGQPSYDLTDEWLRKFKHRYGIQTEPPPGLPSVGFRMRKRRLVRPEMSEELLQRRSRLGKSYAIDEQDSKGSNDEQKESQDEEKEAENEAQEEIKDYFNEEQQEDSDSDSLCGFSFEDLNSVPEWKPFACNQCNERYLWRHQLREHMKCHTEIKTFLCTECGKSYKSAHNLKIHTRGHTGDRPFVCTICDKGFMEQSALTKHIRIHTGERPFLCSDCGTAFISKTQLNLHNKSHHPGVTPAKKAKRCAAPICTDNNAEAACMVQTCISFPKIVLDSSKTGAGIMDTVATTTGLIATTTNNYLSPVSGSRCTDTENLSSSRPLSPGLSRPTSPGIGGSGSITTGISGSASLSSTGSSNSAATSIAIDQYQQLLQNYTTQNLAYQQLSVDEDYFSNT